MKIISSEDLQKDASKRVKQLKPNGGYDMNFSFFNYREISNDRYTARDFFKNNTSQPLNINAPLKRYMVERKLRKRNLNIQK